MTKAKPLIDKETRYEDDYVCRVFVSMYPKGQTLAVIGGMLGLSRERVRQIEERALRKLRAAGATFDLEDPVEETAVELGAACLGAARKKVL